MKPPVTLDVYPNGMGERLQCADCAEWIEEEADFVWEPAPEIAPNAMVSAHLACAVNNGYRLVWPA